VRIRHLVSRVRGPLALRPIRHTLAAAAALVLALAYAPGALADDAGGRPGKTNVTVMTRNLYLGADLGPAITAPNLPQFLAATSAIWTHVQQVSFPERARVLADEIAHAKPDLVGLQEAAMWRTGPIGDPAPATTVVYDYLALLLAELDAADAPYDVVISQDEADLEAPAGAPYFQDIRLTQRDVILVRHGADLELSHAASAHFATNLPIPVAATGTTFISTRGWTSVDVAKKHKTFRFVNTHLEAFHAGVRLVQAQELLAGPLATGPGRVVLAGDLNSGPELPVPENRLAYLALVAGGLVDSWPILHPGDPGFTSSLGDDLIEPPDALENRIDMVMFRGAGIKPIKSELVGNDPRNRTPGGLWPSDHLGHVATLRIG
jgi:endonuclease/exonuclease/phosphatase family metal-dependent hydrolase